MRKEWLSARGIVASTVMSLATANAAAPSADRLRTAAEEFDSGRRAYQLKDFEAAAVHFENADRDSPSADALFAAIRSRYEAGQLARAATLASSGQARYPQDKTIASYGARIIPEAESRLHKLVVKCAPECTVVLDGKLVPLAVSVNVTLYLDSGAHSVVAGWPGDRHITREIPAVAGGSTEMDVKAPPKVDEPTGAVSPKTPSKPDEGVEATPGDKGNLDVGGLPPVVFWIGAGATAVLGGLSIWSGLDTVQNPGTQAVKTACDADPQSQDCHSLFDLGKSHESRTNVLVAATAGIGVASGIVGLFFTNWSRGEKKADSVKTLTPLLGISGGLTVGAQGRF